MHRPADEVSGLMGLLDYFLKRELPPTAKPYREEFHDLAVQPAE